jgi:TonB family protein
MKNASLILLLALAVLVALPRSGRGAPAPNSVPDHAAGAERWKSDLHGADQDLRAGRWQEAYGKTATVLQSMQDHMQGGEGAGQLLATAVLLEAVAAEGLGKIEDAAWNWLIALNLYPGIEAVDLGVYGVAGTRLRDYIAAELVPVSAGAADAKPDDSSPAVSAWFRARRGGTVAELREKDAAITKPEKIASPPPRYPAGARHACQNGTVVIESILDKTGRVKDFHVRQSMSPLLDLAALQALQQWRFKPALVAGKPVQVFYTLTINFATRDCVPRG